MSRPLIDYAKQGLKLDIPVFDCHAHVGRMAHVESVPLEEQVMGMDRLGIEVTAVSSLRAIGGDIQRGNDEVAEAMRRFPGRFIGYCHVSACYPDLMETELERCFAVPGFRGVKVYQVGPSYTDPLFLPAWEFARRWKAPVLAHTWGGNLTGFDVVAEKYPEVAFLMGHSGSAFAYEPYLKAAKKCPNLYLDLTYSREHTNMIEHFVEEIGPDRIVWGPDAPLFSQAQQLSKVLYARISDQAKRKILFDTAARLFRLSGVKGNTSLGM